MDIGKAMQLILGTQELLRIFCFFSWRIGACMHAKLLQLCTTLCDPLDCSLSGSSVHGILHARILEWVAIRSFCCCKKGDPFQGPESGSYLTLRKELFEEMHVLTKQVTLLERAPQWGEHQGKGTQENCSALCLTVSGFTVMALVSGLSLATHSDSGSFLVVHKLLSQDGCQREGFWEVVVQVVSPFALS